MALLCQPGAEPIPGYRLVQRLGSGGYGEVWKATAPGELTKAIKIVYGHLRDARAAQELKALGRIKEVRHPFILSLERFEIVDNQLFIVMELADGSLMDRFEECKQSGLPGIPRDELLGYLLDAADALDYMGEQYGLQHLDIKPQNLLLVGGRVKLADFGLVKDLEESSAAATGGITPIYATPEAFDGRVSRYSDQYSLAIVYQEMLTGHRPFPGTTTLQLAAQHTKCPPLLHFLDLPDRPAIARALSKIPEQRFPTCREMVQHLLGDGGGTARPMLTKVHSGIRRIKPPPQPAVEETANTSSGTLSARTGDARISGTQPVPPANAVTTERAVTLTPGSCERGALRPTLFVGVGGIAGWTLRRLRQRLQRRFGDLARLPILRLLHLDTDRSSFQPVASEGTDTPLGSRESLLLPLRRPEHYRDQARGLLRWLDRRWLYNIPPSLLTEGARPLGRLALVDNAAELLTCLRESVAAFTDRTALRATVQATGLELRDDNPQVYVVASMAGGTGSGMVLSLAYALRQVLAELHLSAASVCGILVQATSQRPREAELARLNAYATLTELQHLSVPEAVYPGDPEHGLTAFGPHAPPFGEVYIVDLGDQLDQARAEAATEPLADYLHLCAASGVGGFLDQWRQQTANADDSLERELRLRAFGLHRLSFPALPVAAQAAELFCKHLVNRWCGSSASWEEKPTDKAASGPSPWDVDPQTVTQQLQAAALAVFGEEPEQSYERILADCPLDRMPPPAPAQLARLAQEALTKIDIFLGPGPDPESGIRTTLTPIDKALTQQVKTLAADLGRALVKQFVGLVEDPDKRLRLAYRAAQECLDNLRTATSNLRGLLAQMRHRRAMLRSRFAEGDFGARGAPSSWRGTARTGPLESSPKQQLLDYCALRLEENLVEYTAQVLDALAGQVSDFLQELAKGGEVLRLLAASFSEPSADTPAPSATLLALPNLTELLPERCHSVPEAAQRMLRNLEPQLRLPFEKVLQAEVLDPQGGLWKLALGARERLHLLKGELQQRAQAAFRDALREVDAGKLFLDSRREPERALRDLLAYLRAVAPNLEVPKAWQHLVLALPASSAGARIGELLHPTLAEMPHTLLDSDGDIILCHEVAYLPLQQMAELLLGDEAALAEAVCHVLTRKDIPWSPLFLGRTARL